MRKTMFGTACLLLIVLSIGMVSANDNQNNRCHDTDRGIDPYVSGSVRAGSLYFEDTCIIDDAGVATVQEGSCAPFDGWCYTHGVSRTVRYPSFEYLGYTINVSEIGEDYAVFHILRNGEDKEYTINVGGVKHTTHGIIIRLDRTEPERDSVVYSVANEYFKIETKLCPGGCSAGACIGNTTPMGVFPTSCKAPKQVTVDDSAADAQTDVSDIDAGQDVEIDDEVIEAMPERIFYLKEHEPRWLNVNGVEHEFNLLEAGKGFCSIDVDKDQIDIALGEEGTINGVKIKIVDASYDDGFCGVTLAPGIEERDYVDIKVYPSMQTVNSGENAVYTVSVKDNHPLYRCGAYDEDSLAGCSPQIYSYNLRIRDLPYEVDFPDSVVLRAGEQRDLKLMINTRRAVNVEEAEEIAVNPVKEEITAEKPTIAIAPEVQEVELHMFKVLAKGEGSKDIATATLGIKRGVVPPPPPTDVMKIGIHKGWNLVGIPAYIEMVIEGKDIEELSIFIFLKEEQRYVALEEAKKILGSNMKGYMRKNGFWIYSETEKSLVIEITEKTNLEEIELVKGWNIMPLTYDMVGGNLVSISGNCDIKRVYAWDSQEQGWNNISLGYEFRRQFFGASLLVKSGNRCSLGYTTITPPSMPN